MANGMLGDLFSTNFRNLRQEEQDEEQRLQYQAQDPFRAMAHASYSGASMAGKGLGRAVTAAAGGDPRTPTERNTAAVEAAKAQVSKMGFSPEDPSSIDQFYKNVIAILQKQGLAAEALAVAKEWNTYKSARTREDLALKREQRMSADSAAKRALDERKLAILEKKGLKTPETLELLKAYEGATSDFQRQAIADRLNFLSTRAGKGVKFMPLGDRMQIINADTGEEIREEEIGEKPETPTQRAKREAADDHDQFAYGEIKADMQRQIDKVAELHNHPGLDGIVGVFDQYVADKDAGITGAVATALASGPARAAAELWKSITGGTLLTGLAKLKRESPKGASGLGALSEKEGEKVQADAAALGRSQPKGDLRLRLRQYIEDIKGGSDRLDVKAQSTGASVIALNIPALTARGGRPSNNPAPRTPVVPAAAPAGGGLSPEKKARLEELRRKKAQGTLK